MIPALKDSVESFAAMLPQHLATLEGWWANLSALLSQYGVVLPAFTLDLERIYTAVLNFLTSYGQALMDTTIGVTTSIFSAAVNFVLALVFSLYVLAQKETLSRQVTKTMRALLPEKKAAWLMDLAALTNKTFSNFITGQLTEAVILGSLCFVGMVLFKMPYGGVRPHRLHRPHSHLRRVHRHHHRRLPHPADQPHQSLLVCDFHSGSPAD